jgi:hypothetical protein
LIFFFESRAAFSAELVSHSPVKSEKNGRNQRVLFHLNIIFRKPQGIAQLLIITLSSSKCRAFFGAK